MAKSKSKSSSSNTGGGAPAAPAKPSPIQATLKEVFQFAAKGDVESLSRVTPVSLLSKPDATGLRAIHVAATNGQTAVVEWLVEDEKRDTALNKPDEDARTPLHWAAWHGKADTVRALLEMGAIRDRPTRTGFTPLHYACFSGNLETVKVLVEFGAKLDARDESQQTPRAVAERFEHKEIAEYLEKEAPAISVEARKKYAGLDSEPQLVMDPIVEAVQSNEEMNLERILSTASKVVNEKGVGPAPPATISPARQRQRDLMFGIFMFGVTLILGMTLGRRAKA